MKTIYTLSSFAMVLFFIAMALASCAVGLFQYTLLAMVCFNLSLNLFVQLHKK